MPGSFKVVIAGGSVAGLTLALCLERGGIADYVLLEKGATVAPQLGASIGLHPHGLRILDQLGVWDTIRPRVVPLVRGAHFDTAGRCFARNRFQGMVYERLGYPIIMLERRDFLLALYGGIEDKSKVLTSKAVVDVTENTDGVVVTTSDGSTYSGDMLVGADGIHSVVRKLLYDRAANAHSNGDATAPSPVGETESKPTARTHNFRATYKTIFGISRSTATTCPMPPGSVYNTYDAHTSSATAAGMPGFIYWFFFVKMPVACADPDIPRYTGKDTQALVERFRDRKLCADFTLGDAWDARVEGVMVPLEEGVLERWSEGRVVLVGDAVHKSTTNAGLGGNTAMEGAVTLSNALHSALKAHSSNPPSSSSALSPSLSPSDLAAVFRSYDATHRPRADLTGAISAHLTRVEAQDTWLLKLVSRYILYSVPALTDRLKLAVYAKFARSGARVEFLPEGAGAAKFVCGLKEEEEKEGEKEGRGSTSVGAVWGAAIVLAAAVGLLYRYRRFLE